tara:strand:- start:324 stop:548 length:225 start_codon:yes stop_codon:yes gene_type:complete
MSDYVKCEKCGVEKKYYTKICTTCILLELADTQEKLAQRDELLKSACEALEHYAHRMDSGGTARRAIKKAKDLE